MPAFPKPAFTYNYNVDAQINALRTYEQTKAGRGIPDKAADRLLVATWNIANLGVQDRRDKDHRILAELISWFDLIALQEVNDDLTGLRGIQTHLPPSYRAVFSDADRSGDEPGRTGHRDIVVLGWIGEADDYRSSSPIVDEQVLVTEVEAAGRSRYLDRHLTGADVDHLDNLVLNRSVDPVEVGESSPIRRKHASPRAMVVFPAAFELRCDRHGCLVRQSDVQEVAATPTP